ncbi:MAG: hypothetical protein R3F20_07345 [Planctomycetota bacterium]
MPDLIHAASRTLGLSREQIARGLRVLCEMSGDTDPGPVYHADGRRSAGVRRPLLDGLGRIAGAALSRRLEIASALRAAGVGPESAELLRLYVRDLRRRGRDADIDRLINRVPENGGERTTT